jgi:hypothetical protein
MTADDEGPEIRWQSIRDFYDEFAREQGWEFLRPMAELSAWVAHQPWAAELYPSTSHEWLCVKLKPGYDCDVPFFACGARPDGQFECTLCAKVGHDLERRRFPIEEAQTAFWNFVRRLSAYARRPGGSEG